MSFKNLHLYFCELLKINLPLEIIFDRFSDDSQSKFYTKKTFRNTCFVKFCSELGRIKFLNFWVFLRFIWDLKYYQSK